MCEVDMCEGGLLATMTTAELMRGQIKREQKNT